MAFFNRHVLALKTGFEARSSGDPIDFQRLYHQQSDICMLHLFESFMESAPQLVLQLYIMVTLETWQSWTGECLFLFFLLYTVSEKDCTLFLFFFSRCPLCGEWCKLHWLLLDTPSFDWNTCHSRGHKMFKMAPTKQQKAFCVVEYAKTTSGAFALA